MCDPTSTAHELHYRSYERETTGGYGIQTFWEIVVDDLVRWNDARPVSTTDTTVVPEECLECGMCGTPNVHVRRNGEYVVWFGNPDEWHDLCGLPKGTALFFEASAYDALLPAGDGDPLPLLTAEEARQLAVDVHLPDPHSLLYVDSLFGEAGSRIVHLIVRTQREGGLVPELEFSVDTPVSMSGCFDVEGVLTDFRWEIAVEGPAVLIRFCQSPFLPIWFRVESPDLAGLLARYA